MNKTSLLLLFVVLVVFVGCIEAAETYRNETSPSGQVLLPCRPRPSKSRREDPQTTTSGKPDLPCRPRPSESGSQSESASVIISSSSSSAPSVTSEPVVPSDSNSNTISHSATSSTTLTSTPSTSLSSSSSISLSSSPSTTSSASFSSSPTSSASISTSSSTSTSTSSSPSNPPSLSTSLSPSTSILPSISTSTPPLISVSPSIVPSPCPLPSPSPSCNNPQPPCPETVSVRFSGLCCSSNASISPVFPRPFQVRTDSSILNVEFSYDNLLECSEGNCDLRLIVEDLLHVFNSCPCRSSRFFSRSAHLYFHLSDGNMNHSSSPVSSLDLSDPSQLDTLFGYIRQEVVQIYSFGLDVERQTVVLVAKVRYSFPRNSDDGSSVTSVEESGCVVKEDACGVKEEEKGEEVVVSILFAFDQKDCLIEEVVVVPSKKDFLAQGLEQVNGRIPTSNFCFKDCSSL